jgi:sugar phosphate isomerase/epimerase
VNGSAPIGIGHLTMLDVAPPQWVGVAAYAGFDAVGIRVAVAASGEAPWPMTVGTPMLAETVSRLDDTGVEVLDVEIIRLTPDTTVAAARPLLEVGALLGARFVNVIAADSDLKRAKDTFAEIAEAAAGYGLRMVVEAISYTPVSTLDDALLLVKGSAGGIIVNPLHLHRSGGTPEQLVTVDPAMLGYCQLCDAPSDPPHGLSRPSRLPRGQSPDVTDAQLESRAMRLLPGEGDLPLRELVAVMPTSLPISVEAPNLALLQQLGPFGFARRARESVSRLLAPLTTRRRGPGGAS